MLSWIKPIRVFFIDEKAVLKEIEEDFSSNEQGLISFSNVLSLSQPGIYYVTVY